MNRTTIDRTRARARIHRGRAVVAAVVVAVSLVGVGTPASAVQLTGPPDAAGNWAVCAVDAKGGLYWPAYGTSTGAVFNVKCQVGLTPEYAYVRVTWSGTDRFGNPLTGSTSIGGPPGVVTSNCGTVPVRLTDGARAGCTAAWATRPTRQGRSRR